MSDAGKCPVQCLRRATHTLCRDNELINLKKASKRKDSISRGLGCHPIGLERSVIRR